MFELVQRFLSSSQVHVDTPLGTGVGSPRAALVIASPRGGGCRERSGGTGHLDAGRARSPFALLKRNDYRVLDGPAYATPGCVTRPDPARNLAGHGRWAADRLTGINGLDRSAEARSGRPKMRIMDFATRLESAGLVLVDDAVAEGGSAVLHKARVQRQCGHLPEEGSFVAVKQHKDSILAIPGQLDRIQQEADVGRRIQHDHFVRTYGLLQDGGPPALLLEWIEGRTLEKWYFSQPKPHDWSTLQRFALGIARGLEGLHAAGVHHRDIKPENIMIDANERAVLMDIGVAEITADVEHTMHTSVKEFVGSVRTASPQFILGERYDAKDDVYSLGATCHFMFTGKRLFDEVERKPVLPIMIVTAVPQVAALQPDVPAPMKVLLQASLHRTRERRPSLAEFIECLERPDNAAILSRELERQGAEERSYSVIRVMDNGASFFADLAGDDVSPGSEYTIVRKLAPLSVPSYQKDIVPEKWIAEAVLKHINQNVGYFKIIGKRWEESRHATGIASLGLSLSGGRWVEFEKFTDTVREGDLVLKNSV